MDKKLKTKWLKALRSGRYRQITDELHNSSGYCCLGVLCRVMGVPAKEIYSVGMLADAGIKGHGLNGKQAVKLATMNDDDGKNFREIADWIEANVKVSRR